MQHSVEHVVIAIASNNLSISRECKVAARGIYGPTLVRIYGSCLLHIHIGTSKEYSIWFGLPMLFNTAHLLIVDSRLGLMGRTGPSSHVSSEVMLVRD